MTESNRSPEYEARYQAAPYASEVCVIVLIVALLLAFSGCAIIKAALPELMKAYGIPAIPDLLADAKERGKVAIDEAREKAEAIPDQLDRIEALAEVNRAEQVYQTSMLEYLVSCHPPEMPEAQPSASAVSK